jgi:hypothetical protein
MIAPDLVAYVLANWDYNPTTGALRTKLTGQPLKHCKIRGQHIHPRVARIILMVGVTPKSHSYVFPRNSKDSLGKNIGGSTDMRWSNIRYEL